MQEDIDTVQEHLSTSLFNYSSHAASPYPSIELSPSSNYHQHTSEENPHSTETHNVLGYPTPIDVDHACTHNDRTYSVTQTEQRSNPSVSPATCTEPAQNPYDPFSPYVIKHVQKDAQVPVSSFGATPSSFLRGYQLQVSQKATCGSNIAPRFFPVLNQSRGLMLLQRTCIWTPYHRTVLYLIPPLQT